MDSDLKLHNADLDYTTSGDLKIVSNIEDIWQQINLKLMTKSGDNLFANSDYGTNLGSYVDENITDDIKKEIVSEVSNAILQDKRIDAVKNVSITSSASTLTLNITIVLNDGTVTSRNITLR